MTPYFNVSESLTRATKGAEVVHSCTRDIPSSVVGFALLCDNNGVESWLAFGWVCGYLCGVIWKLLCHLGVTEVSNIHHERSQGKRPKCAEIVDTKQNK